MVVYVGTEEKVITKKKRLHKIVALHV